MEDFHRGSRLIWRLLLAALVFLPLQVGLAEQVSQLPKPTDYVNDFAHVLTPDAVAKLDRVCSELDHSKANTQIAVVTVHNLDGEDKAVWANQLEDKWHMGKKGSDRGLLVLLAVDDHKYQIDVGYGLEGILNDARVGDIGRSMVPSLRSKDYDGAVVGAVGQLAKIIADDAQVTLSDTLPNPPPVRHSQQQHGSPAGAILLFVILFLMFGGFGIFRILFWLGLFNSALGGRRYTGGSGPFMGGGGWGGGGGGGDSGGGGGFGGFGGGDFGGGGAGGSW